MENPSYGKSQPRSKFPSEHFYILNLGSKDNVRQIKRIWQRNDVTFPLPRIEFHLNSSPPETSLPRENFHRSQFSQKKLPLSPEERWVYFPVTKTVRKRWVNFVAYNPLSRACGGSSYLLRYNY